MTSTIRTPGPTVSQRTGCGDWEQLKRMAEQLGWREASLSTCARQSRYERQSRSEVDNNNTSPGAVRFLNVLNV